MDKKHPPIRSTDHTSEKSRDAVQVAHLRRGFARRHPGATRNTIRNMMRACVRPEGIQDAGDDEVIPLTS